MTTEGVDPLIEVSRPYSLINGYRTMGFFLTNVIVGAGALVLYVIQSCVNLRLRDVQSQALLPLVLSQLVP
jgi:hypothetical protein